MAERNSKINKHIPSEQNLAADKPIEYTGRFKTANDVIDFFLERESLELFYGFSRNALAAKNAIEEIIQAQQEEETIQALRAEGVVEIPEKEKRERIYLPLQGGAKGRQIYQHEMTEAHLELFDTVYLLTRANLMASEIDDNNPRGRVWYQGRYTDEQSGNSYPMNFIEIHDHDEKGQYIKWQLVTNVPDELIFAEEPSIRLHPAQTKLMFRQGMNEIEEMLSGDSKKAA